SLTLVAAYQWAGRLGLLNAVGGWTSPRVEYRTRHHPVAGLVFRLGSTHAAQLVMTRRPRCVVARPGPPFLQPWRVGALYHPDLQRFVTARRSASVIPSTPVRGWRACYGTCSNNRS